MDAKTGTTFLTHLHMQGVITEADIAKAFEIAGANSPSSAINLARMHASLLMKDATEMQHLSYAKGVRWLAILRRDNGDEIFSIYALSMASETGALIDEVLVQKLPNSGVRKSVTLAYRKHAGQYRLGGERHFEHVLRVALASAFYNINLGRHPIDVTEAFQAGVLHDILEDTDATAETLRAWYMSEKVIKAVQAVTHEDDDEPDAKYLAQVASGGKLAILTKRFDRLDNIKSLVNAPADFRAKKIAEIWKAVNEGLWDFDPEGKALIIRELSKLG